jgi:hypothetical protein
MSGFKSFSQKTTTNQNVLLSAANEHSEVKHLLKVNQKQL